MNFLKLGQVGALALVAGVSVSMASACSSSPPAPEAFVEGEINAGSETGVNDVGACSMSVGLSWQLGNSTQPTPTTKPDGSNQNGGAVHVTCTVDPSGSGFAIQLSAELGGQMAGTLFVSGNIGSNGMGTGLTGSFATAGQNFRDMGDCTFTMTYGGSPLPPAAAPAAGRIWGHIDCPHAQESGQQGTNAMGMPITRTCEAQADVFFQNCG